ncbi:MAG TPA: adenylate/guanylate cyclase domain-containing protein [Ramlibacter sp.]|nr:adenylate/guanylate cyclase domain-containing protein [Ramlibacter sp.]
MLTSKEILERTGISRATLNNYIAAGLVARPDVLPPAPEDGAAPRIGYFPDDTLERIRTIQRLKRQGWSIGRISEHFSRGDAVPAEPREPVTLPAPAIPIAPALRLQLADAGSPAYLVDERFTLVWANPACAASALSPVPGLRNGDAVLGHLIDSNAPGTHAVLRFQLAAAKDRGWGVAQLSSGLAPAQAARLAQLHEEARATGAMPVSHVSLAATGGLPLRIGFAVHFREHLLFAYSPAQVSGTAPPRPAAQAPSLASVVVLVATLQDATGLWARLSPHEYFELANEVWAELDAVFRRHRAVLGRHPGEGLVCYFLREPDEGHLANALAAARAAKEAMRALSQRWQQRKHWDAEVAMNMGLDEGQEWMGAIGADEFRVLGEAAERADQLSRCGRAGSIYVTRGFIGKLPASERARLEFAAPRAETGARRTRHTFAPLSSVCPAVPPRLAEVAVAEVLDLPASAA